MAKPPDPHLGLCSVSARHILHEMIPLLKSWIRPCWFGYCLLAVGLYTIVIRISQTVLFSVMRRMRLCPGPAVGMRDIPVSGKYRCI